MRRLTAAFATAAILMATPLNINEAHAARSGPTDACAPIWTARQPRPGYFGQTPCSEVERAITEAVQLHPVNGDRFRRVIRCESSFNPHVNRWGLVQLTDGFWNREMPRFNAANDPDIFDRNNPFHNARLAAWVIVRDGQRDRDPGPDGYGQWSCKG